MDFTVTQIASLFHDHKRTDEGNPVALKKKMGWRSGKALMLATKSDTSHLNIQEMQKKMGVQSEDKMLNMYEKQIGKPITNRNDQIYSVTIEMNGKKLAAHGKLDGFIKEGNIVVEHKRRTRGLINRVLTHERVQCHLYMRMCNSERTHLVESFNDHIQVHVIDFDETFWQRVCSRWFMLSDYIL